MEIPLQSSWRSCHFELLNTDGMEIVFYIICLERCFVSSASAPFKKQICV